MTFQSLQINMKKHKNHFNHIQNHLKKQRLAEETHQVTQKKILENGIQKRREDSQKEAGWLMPLS